MNYYPEQLEYIAKLCRALNAIDSANDADGHITIKNRVPVVDGASESDVYGYLVDEIGGAWSFEPVGQSK